MATAPYPLTPRFQQRLEEFKHDLSPDQEENFKFTTLEELKQLVHDIQEVQMKSRRLTNLRRLAPFLEAMDQFDKVAQVFLNAADLLAFIWGPVKFLLLATQTYHDAFNALLDAYVDIGESIPLLAQYEQVFQDKSQMHVVLEFVYTDVMDFHSSAIKYFRSPVWKQLFHATWKTFRTKFEPTLNNLRRHKSLLETQSNLLFLQQYQLDRQRTQMEFESVEREAELNRNIAIANWLSPAHSESDYQAAASARLENPNSCQWILQHQQMKRWLDPQYPLQPLLWVNGKPGAGKTVLASLIVEECRKSSSGQAMFFFHKYGDEKRNSLIAILRGFLAQAIRMKPLLIPYLFEEAAKSGSGSLEDIELAQSLIEVSLAAFDSLFFILDGLDECPKLSKKPITTFFRSLVDKSNQQTPGSFRCLFFSQQDNDLGDLLKTIPSFTITGEQNGNDIRSFCHIKARKIQEELEYPEERVNRMADKVSSRADGMFVFAVLIMKYLEEQTSWRNLEREVEDMPLNLNEVYERIIKRVLYDSAPAERTAARMLLGWILAAVRPLKWREIQGAIAYDEFNHSFDLEASKLRKGPKRLCGSLVELFDDGEVRLVHLSAKLYLERNVISGPEEELKLLSRCLNYLRLPAFHHNLEEEIARSYVLNGHYAFLDYALPSWTVHFENILRRQQLEQKEVFEELAGLFRAFFEDHAMTKNQSLQDKGLRKIASPFKDESFFDQLVQTMRLAQHLSFDKKHEKSLPDSSGYLIPQVTLVRRVIEEFASDSEKIPQLQEVHGSKLFKCPNLRCRYFAQGFSDSRERDKHVNEHKRPYRCTYSGCVVTLLGYPTEQQLRRHEAEAHFKGPDALTFPCHGTPTSSEACDEIRRGNEEVFDWWIDQFEGDIPLEHIWQMRKGSRSARSKGPLRTAITTGNVQILRRILDRLGYFFLAATPDHLARLSDLVRDALETLNSTVLEEIICRANALTGSHILPLFIRATELDLDRVAVKLLEHNHFGLQPSIGHQCLAHATRNGRIVVMRDLIFTKHVDPSIYSVDGHSALCTAAIYNQIDAGRFLVESGTCKKQSRSLNGLTAGQLAHQHGNLGFMEAIFLEATSKPEWDDQAWTIVTQLLRAAYSGDLSMVQAIISQSGAPINPASDGPTPLHLAVSGHHTAVVDALLRTEMADPDQQVNLHARNNPRLNLKADRAIFESVMQQDAVLFGRLLEYSGLVHDSLLEEYVEKEGTAEMLEAIKVEKRGRMSTNAVLIKEG